MLRMRAIPDSPGYYVTNTGRVWSTTPWRGTTGRWIKAHPNDRGYLTLRITTAAGRRTMPVHRIVAETFHGPRPDGLETRHLNGNKLDNRPENLRYGTHAENMRDIHEHGGWYQTKRATCPQGHPYDEVNTYITPQGKRSCRTCRRKQALAYWRRKNA